MGKVLGRSTITGMCPPRYLTLLFNSASHANGTGNNPFEGLLPDGEDGSMKLNINESEAAASAPLYYGNLSSIL